MIASLHLHGVHGRGVARAVGRMALDRRLLAATPGLRFWKLLGTGRGRTFTPRDADPGRWGLFAVWDGPDALERFEAESRVAAAWRSFADEQWRAELAPVRWKGRWSGRDPFAGAVAVGADVGAARVEVATDGRVAALTRARVRPRQWRQFWGAVPPVAAELHTAGGLCLALGIGEAPVGLQATFSLWDGDAALDAFAYRGEAHRAVIQRTHTAGWYAEELFARFAVLSTRGTVGGRAL